MRAEDLRSTRGVLGHDEGEHVGMIPAISLRQLGPANEERRRQGIGDSARSRHHGDAGDAPGGHSAAGIQNMSVSPALGDEILFAQPWSSPPIATMLLLPPLSRALLTFRRRRFAQT